MYVSSPVILAAKNLRLFDANLGLLLVTLFVLVGVPVSCAGMAQNYVRIDIRYPGLYRIPAADLALAGADIASINPGLLNLQCDGEDVMFRLTGAEDGKLHPADSIEFVGYSARGESTWHMRDNKRNVYFLRWDRPGKIAQTKTPLNSNSSGTPDAFWQTQHIEKDYIYHFTLLPPDQSDSFFSYAYRAGMPLNKNLWTEIRFPSFDKRQKTPAHVQVQVFGATNASGLKPSHHFIINYNAKAVGQVNFDGTGLHRTSFVLTADQIEEAGRFGFTTPEGRESAVDSILLDWINIKYPSRFDADYADIFTFNNDLVQSEATTKSLAISGLPANAAIFDPATLTVWELGTTQTEAVIPNSAEPTTFTAVAPHARLRADNVAYVDLREQPLKLPSDLETLVVYHPDLKITADTYTQYRREKGWNIQSVSVRSIFDQYSDGYVSDSALKQYIREAKLAAPQLSHVVLIGDAYFDYREARTQDELKQLEILIPIHWVYRPGVTWSGGYQDDNWYGSFENDFRPDIAVGRIAVNTNNEGMEYIRKVIEYETLKNSADDHSLMISSVEKSFQQYVKEVGTTYKEKLSSVTYLFPIAAEATREVSSLITEINKGVQLLYYVGHGGSLVWRVGPADFTRQKDLFTPEDVKQLANHGHYPVVVCASCYTTAFDQPESIGEAFVNQPSAGAIAVIGAPWKATVQESHDFNRKFFKYYFDSGVRTLGEASLKAHREHVPANQGHALFNSFILLGDPCLEIVR